MGFEKGHEKAGGRTKGTPNKRTSEAREIAERLGVCPLEVLLLFAGNKFETLGLIEGAISPELRVQSANSAAPYLFPKLAAVELTGKDGGPITIEDFLQAMANKK